MTVASSPVDTRLFARWVRASFWGWLLGFVFIVLGAVLGDGVGLPTAQFIVGVGMGAGIGLLQGRVLRPWLGRSWLWMLATTVGLGTPFLAFDIAATWVELYSLPVSIAIGGLFVGVLQRRLLAPHSERANWWVLASIGGWGLVAVPFALESVPTLGTVVTTATFVFGGILVGSVTGKVLVWMLRS